MDDKNITPRIGFSKILYLPDLSEAGRYAFPYAASLAHRYGAVLTVFHVMEKHDFEKYLVGYINEDLWEELKTRNLNDAKDILVHRKRDDTVIKDSLEKLCEECMSADGGHPYVSYDIALESGDPVEEVLKKADQGNYDLIVVGKHGPGIVEGALLGDTARRIVRRCTIPVLVVQVPDDNMDESGGQL
mgnify:CR=1 FL=1